MFTGIEHIGIMVSDMDKSLKFYQEILGFELRKRTFIRDETIELAFLYQPSNPYSEVELIAAPNTDQDGVVNHLALSVENIEEAVAHLVSHNIKMDGDIIQIFPDTKIVFFRGPNHEKLELVERRR
ncbi:VOC family protein [Bacillus alkalicellulosilyticus]|uniref:VOC family protein n=1 Tax=Alkalihalobacterium alkalicellulosilyticum TaxID=1912214 RepID=UPI000996AA8E|nr:VOC family protein [Bacillus alkalicellulosilyticus]